MKLALVAIITLVKYLDSSPAIGGWPAKVIRPYPKIITFTRRPHLTAIYPLGSEGIFPV
jgi:hypothetical protein